MWIMIAGPYTTGAATQAQRDTNFGALNEAAYAVLRRGHVPVIGINLALPVIESAGPEHYDEIMMPLSLAIAERCDGILRIGGESHGADREVEVVRAHGGRVFASLDDIPDTR